MNNYLTEIKTKILKRKYVDDTTHIVPTKNILLDYEKFNLEQEDIYVNGSKVNSIYDSSLGKVFVVNFKPENDDITINVDFNNRLTLLKSVTSRILIKSILYKYFNLKALNFHSGFVNSSFCIEGVFFDKEAKDIIELLEKNIREYIKYGIDINHNKEQNTSSINGLVKTIYQPNTVSNLSELNNFKILKYKFTNIGLEITYIVD